MAGGWPALGLLAAYPGVSVAGTVVVSVGIGWRSKSLELLNSPLGGCTTCTTGDADRGAAALLTRGDAWTETAGAWGTDPGDWSFGGGAV